MFIERGILLLSNGGIISYITPSNFATNNYCLKLRKFLLENLAIHNIVFYSENVFQANVNNLVFVGQRKKTTGNIKLFKAKRAANDWEYSNETTIEQAFFMRENYLIVPSVDIKNTAILDKIDKRSKKLMEYACVNFGMQLRDRKYYPADVTMDKTKLTSDHRPCYTGKNIEKWRVNYSGLFCYFNREAKQGGCWDESVQLANPKILCRQIGVAPFFGIDLRGYLMLNTGFMITKIVDGFKPMALMGILNSKLLKYYWLQKFTDERKQFPKIKGTYIELLPIRRNVQIEERLHELVSMIIASANAEQDFAIYEKEIDKYVYKLYDLTDEEIVIVEKSVE